MTEESGRNIFLEWGPRHHLRGQSPGLRGGGQDHRDLREKITDHVQEVGAYLTLRLGTGGGRRRVEQRKGTHQGLKVRRPAGR